MAKVLAYTSPAVGHLYPLVGGLLALQDLGHEIHVRTLPRALDELAAAGLSASAVAAGVLEVEVTDYRATSRRQRLVSGLHDVMARGALDGRDLEAAVAEHRPDALVVDVNAYGAVSRAEAGGLPWAMAMPSLVPVRGAGIPPYSLGLRPARGPLGRLRDAALWPLVDTLYGRAMLPGLNALRRDAGLEPLASPLDLFGRPDRLLMLTSEPLEYPRRDLPGHVRFVGCQPWDPPSQEPAWLTEAGDPWVLVTCSTDYQGDESLARTAVEALRDEPYRLLLTVGDALASVGLSSSANIVVTDFVPHEAVLPHAAVVVTHGGMGITGKAALAGVPQVVVPFGRDQPEIARRVSEAGIGFRLPAARLTAPRLRRAVQDALRLRPRASAVGRRLRSRDATGLFATAVQELVDEPRPNHPELLHHEDRA